MEPVKIARYEAIGKVEWAWFKMLFGSAMLFDKLCPSGKHA
ncbi:MAG: hypothetical protein AMXMBFR7_52780 [Planctomycetota bacterium]